MNLHSHNYTGCHLKSTATIFKPIKNYFIKHKGCPVCNNLLLVIKNSKSIHIFKQKFGKDLLAILSIEDEMGGWMDTHTQFFRGQSIQGEEDWLIDWLIDWQTDWVTDWLIDWLID